MRPRALHAVLLAIAAAAPSNPGCDPGVAGGASRGAGAAIVESAASAAAAALASLVVPVAGQCAPSPRITLFVSPAAPRPGAPLRVVAVAAEPLDASLGLRDPDGRAVPLTASTGGGPPYSWLAEIAAPAPGTYRAALGQGSKILACREIDVAPEDASEPPDGHVRLAWQDKARWTRSAEDLYSAWIERLFDAPLDTQPVWPLLSTVLRDPRRIFLHDHLALGEDDPPPRGLSLEPDCADLPYFLRAYFAFKLSLPFGFSSCTRGAGGIAPACLHFRNNRERPPIRRHDPAVAFGEFLRITVADTVHSGSGRVLSTTDGGDYYPVPLSAEALRPGTVYADPYGHVLVVARRVPQTAESGGVLLAIDGQPDGTVSRRRYWRGNFLFALDPALGDPGFKRFRPVVRDGEGLRPLTNDEIARSDDYGDYSRDQYLRGALGFYDKMDAVLSPAPRDPRRALLETIQALEEQVTRRVVSVQNGDRYWAEHHETIDMPKGAEIFETTGPWEDYSTPSRDLRLLIAIDVVRGFPARVEQSARRGAAGARYAVPLGRPPAEVRAELEAALDTELAGRSITYTRSDGSARALSLADVVARAGALEIAYDPNDCPEIRWGALEGTDEAATCDRRAPWAQRARMLRYRAWFHERRRPPRK